MSINNPSKGVIYYYMRVDSMLNIYVCWPTMTRRDVANLDGRKIRVAKNQQLSKQKYQNRQNFGTFT